MKTSEKLDEILPAMLAIQKEIENPLKDAEGYGYNYVSLPSLLDSLRPLANKHKCVISQLDSETGIDTFLFHESGQFIGGTTPWIEVEKLETPDVTVMGKVCQANGAQSTYLRRYALEKLFGICATEDTDGIVVSEVVCHFGEFKGKTLAEIPNDELKKFLAKAPQAKKPETIKFLSAVKRYLGHNK